MTGEEEILGRIGELWDRVDPAPGGLAELTAFAYGFTTPDDEIARAIRGPRTAGARGDTLARSITFESPSLTIMVSINDNDDGTVRVDGWLTPPAAHPVELRTSDGVRSTASDDTGRFSFSRVVRALTQFAVRTNGTVSTPAIAF